MIPIRLMLRTKSFGLSKPKGYLIVFNFLCLFVIDYIRWLYALNPV